MTIHPREKIEKQAGLKLMHCLEEIREGLTEAEFMKVLISELSGELLHIVKYMIREERHPGEDKAGGIE